MTKRAVLYARVSGDDRGREGRNLAGQLDMCRQYALDHGWEIVEELAEDDRGASGAAFELPQLNRVRGLAQMGAFDVLVTRELDRLSRSLAKQLFVEEELRHGGVSIDYVLGEYPDTPEGNFLKNVRAAVAELEREKIKERMVRGRDLKVKSGSVLVYGRPPFGYNVIQQGTKWILEINEPEADIVRLIFQWDTFGDGVEGPMSTFRLHQRLHELSIPSPADFRPNQPKKKLHPIGRWNLASIQKSLDRETYAGTWHWNKHTGPKNSRTKRPKDEWVAVEVPAIISRETWEATKSRRQHNRVESIRNRKYEYLLARRLRCGKCGMRMTARTLVGANGPKYAYYRCYANDGSLVHYAYKCGSPYFRTEGVDEAVWEWVKTLLVDKDALVQGLEALQEQRALAPTHARWSRWWRGIVEIA